LAAYCPVLRNFAPTFRSFKAQLPEFAKEIHYQPDEISGFGDYRTFVWRVTEFLKTATRVF